VSHVEAGHLGYVLPDGRTLLDDVSFRVGNAVKAALIGPNGAGKTTLMRLLAGDLPTQSGTISRGGSLGVMRQFIGSIRDETDTLSLLVSAAPERLRTAGQAVAAAEQAMAERDDEPAQLRYATALAEWGDAGGYEAEVLWDVCCGAALGTSLDAARHRPVRTLSGGEQKRLVLEALLRGPADVLLLDEPDNYLDVPGKLWLEEQLRATAKTVLLISHDRELLARAAERIITVEGGRVWVHGGGFASYVQARQDRIGRLEELRRRWDEEHAKLRKLVFTLRQQAMYSDALSSRYQAAQTRLRMFTDAGPPEAPPPDQNVTVRLRGGRTGKRAVICENLELTGLMKPFSTEIWYGDRVGILGSNGSGKSHFLRLLAQVARDAGRDAGGDAIEDADPAGRVPYSGVARLGARVVPGLFTQTHTRPELEGRTPCEIVMTEHARRQGEAMSALSRYELQHCAEQPFGVLSGGQQARLQILLLELAGATLLLLDEPTDNLDLASAEALQEGLLAFQGTILAVTHDRWFARSFDSYLIFGADGTVYPSGDPIWDEARVARAR
jgi:ATPase subunit of ABC transporter with duplicated ATPase domains